MFTELGGKKVYRLKQEVTQDETRLYWKEIHLHLTGR